MSGVDSRASSLAVSGSGWSWPLAVMFLAFAMAYFMSAMLRAVTATLAPAFSLELQLSAGDLGLLSGAYFFGFSLTQLPLGTALDRHGPKRVILALLALAVLACLWFAQAQTLGSLVLSRALIGVGVSACLMAPLTAYRQWLPPHQQLRANAWMLMTGSLGMLASTLPVHWLLPHLGWRGLFVLSACAIVAAMAFIAWCVPASSPPSSASPSKASAALAPRATAGGGAAQREGSYASIFGHPRFVQLLPAGVFMYGGMIAVQALWAGPWLNQVAGWDAAATARGLFAINLTMLLTFFAWGVVMPKVSARGVDAMRLMRWGLVLPLVMLAVNIALGAKATALHWALWCMASSVVTLSQPRVAQEFPKAVAGRALSAYNLVLFIGIFVVQWGLGLIIDALTARGWALEQAYRGAFAVFGCLCLASYLWYGWCDRRLANAIIKPP